MNTARGWRLSVPAGKAGNYRLSQLDDQDLATSSVSMAAAAYTELCEPSLERPSTWDMGLRILERSAIRFLVARRKIALRLPALPQAAWFFGASPKSYLSLRDDKPANGFYAQVMRSRRVSAGLIAAGLLLPYSPTTTRRALGRVISEDSAAVGGEPSEWHDYAIHWMPERTAFLVDDHLVLESASSPRPPLGLVMWIDNQYAAFDPRGGLRWGIEENPAEVWLEIEDVRVLRDEPRAGAVEPSQAAKNAESGQQYAERRAGQRPRSGQGSTDRRTADCERK